MALKTKSLWDTAALDDDLLPPPVARPTPPTPPERPPAVVQAPPPHLVTDAENAATTVPKKRTEPRRHIMLSLDVELVDAVRQRDWGQMTQAQVLEKALHEHYDEVVAGIDPLRPKPAALGQWGVRLPLPVFDRLTRTRVAAGGATQRAAVESALRVALLRL